MFPHITVCVSFPNWLRSFTKATFFFFFLCLQYQLPTDARKRTRLDGVMMGFIWKSLSLLTSRHATASHLLIFKAETDTSQPTSSQSTREFISDACAPRRLSARGSMPSVTPDPRKTPLSPRDPGGQSRTTAALGPGHPRCLTRIHDGETTAQLEKLQGLPEPCVCLHFRENRTERFQPHLFLRYHLLDGTCVSTRPNPAWPR